MRVFPSTSLEADLHVAGADVDVRRGGDEVGNPMVGFGFLAAVAYAAGEQPIQATGHQRQLQITVDFPGYGAGQGVHGKEVNAILNLVFDEHALGIRLDELGRPNSFRASSARRAQPAGIIREPGRPARRPKRSKEIFVLAQ